MSTDYTLYSTALRIRSADWAQMTDAAQKPLGDYFDSVQFDVVSEHDGVVVFDIYFSGDAGDSFTNRIADLTQAIGKYLLDAGMLTLRENTSTDERDQVFFAGPTLHSINLARLKEHLTCAQEHLLSALPDGDNDHSPVMSAITGVAHGLMHALGLTEKSIDVERETRGSPAPEKSLITPVSTGITEQDQFIEVDTAWGEISLPYGAQFQLGLDGSILVAASTRKDGDADVLGSLNLQAFENRGASREDTCVALARFVESHPDADLFKIVETVPDVLTLNDGRRHTKDNRNEDTDSTPTPVSQN